MESWANGSKSLWSNPAFLIVTFSLAIWSICESLGHPLMVAINGEGSDGMVSVLSIDRTPQTLIYWGYWFREAAQLHFSPPCHYWLSNYSFTTGVQTETRTSREFLCRTSPFWTRVNTWPYLVDIWEIIQLKSYLVGPICSKVLLNTDCMPIQPLCFIETYIRILSSV